MHKLSDFENKKLNDPSLKHLIIEITAFIKKNNIQSTEKIKMLKGEGIDILIRKGDESFYRHKNCAIKCRSTKI